MSTNETTNETTTNETAPNVCELSEYAAMCARQKRDISKLPRIDAFRIDCGAGTGTAKTWHSTGYILMLKPRGVKSFYTAGTIAAAHGMKCKWQFRLAMEEGAPVENAEEMAYNEAKKAGYEIQRTWGRPNKKPSNGKAKLTAAERVARAFAKLSDEDKKAVLDSAK